MRSFVSHQYLRQLGVEVKTAKTVGSRCHPCAMSVVGKYAANLKCCTFIPWVPNYVLGLLLEKSKIDTQGLSKDSRLLLLPVGLVPHPDFREEYLKNKAKGFGVRRDWLCPFFETKSASCSIWEFRPSVCVGHWCEEIDLGDTKSQWETLEEKLFQVETVLSQSCLIEKGYTPKEINHNLEPLQGLRKKSLDLWAHHGDRVDAFYKECYEYVQRCGDQILKEEGLIPVMDEQEKIIDEFRRLKSWEDRYRQIIAIGKAMPPMPESLKTDENKVKGCQSQVWIHAHLDDHHRMQFQADSDALIVRGLVALLVRLYSGQTPQEILQTRPEFVSQLGLEQNLSPSRANGLFAMLRQIHYYALAFSQILKSKGE